MQFVELRYRAASHRRAALRLGGVAQGVVILCLCMWAPKALATGEVKPIDPHFVTKTAQRLATLGWMAGFEHDQPLRHQLHGLYHVVTRLLHQEIGTLSSITGTLFERLIAHLHQPEHWQALIDGKTTRFDSGFGRFGEMLTRGGLFEAGNQGGIPSFVSMIDNSAIEVYANHRGDDLVVSLREHEMTQTKWSLREELIEADSREAAAEKVAALPTHFDSEFFVKIIVDAHGNCSLTGAEHQPAISRVRPFAQTDPWVHIVAEEMLWTLDAVREHDGTAYGTGGSEELFSIRGIELEELLDRLVGEDPLVHQAVMGIVSEMDAQRAQSR